MIRHRLPGYFSGMGTLNAFPRAVLFDRDGTLVEDVPYNGDPALVRPMPGAVEVLRALRAAGIRCAVVSNQSGVARGLLTRDQVEAVNERLDALIGPIEVWKICPHGPDAGCGCRKPAPGMVLAACRELGVDPRDAAVVGDIGADMEAARAAGVRAVLVPTPVTRRQEIADADLVASDLFEAMELLGGVPAPLPEAPGDGPGIGGGAPERGDGPDIAGGVPERRDEPEPAAVPGPPAGRPA